MESGLPRKAWKKFIVPRNSACGEVAEEDSIYGGNTASPVIKGVQMQPPTASAVHISSTANAEGDRNPGSSPLSRMVHPLELFTESLQSLITRTSSPHSKHY